MRIHAHKIINLKLNSIYSVIKSQIGNTKHNCNILSLIVWLYRGNLQGSLTQLHVSISHDVQWKISSSAIDFLLCYTLPLAIAASAIIHVYAIYQLHLLPTIYYSDLWILYEALWE